jgi:hypothetical protein
MIKDNLLFFQKPVLNTLTYIYILNFISNRSFCLNPLFLLRRSFRLLLPPFFSIIFSLIFFCLLILLAIFPFFLPRAFCATARADVPISGQGFSDLKNHGAKSTVYRLAALDLLAGYPDGSFRPEQSVTQLEAVALVMRTRGLSETKTTRIQPKSGSSSATRPGQEQIPAVPWGENYLRLAVENEFLPLPLMTFFTPNAAITRAEMTALLSRVLELPKQPEERTGSGPEDTPAAAKSVPDTPQAQALQTQGPGRLLFADLPLAPPSYIPYIQAVALAGIMSGYPDGNFRPNQGLSRTEMTVLLANLLDQHWIKVPAGRQFTGWISRITQTRGGNWEIEFTTLEGVQKIRPAPDLKCFSHDQESELFQAVNHRVELILNGQKQARYLNIFEHRHILPPSQKLTGTVKSVILGEDNYLQIIDLDCADQTFPLAWSAVVEGKNAKGGFLSLRPETFVEIALTDGKVTKVSVLDVKKISGTVERLTGKTLRLARRGEKIKWPEWFNYWDRARIVDKNGKKIGGVNPRF